MIAVRDLEEHMVLFDLEYTLVANWQKHWMLPVGWTNVVLHLIGA